MTTMIDMTSLVLRRFTYHSERRLSPAAMAMEIDNERTIWHRRATTGPPRARATARYFAAAGLWTHIGALLDSGATYADVFDWLDS